MNKNDIVHNFVNKILKKTKLFVKHDFYRDLAHFQKNVETLQRKIRNFAKTFCGRFPILIVAIGTRGGKSWSKCLQTPLFTNE